MNSSHPNIYLLAIEVPVKPHENSKRGQHCFFYLIEEYLILAHHQPCESQCCSKLHNLSLFPQWSFLPPPPVTSLRHATMKQLCKGTSLRSCLHLILPYGIWSHHCLGTQGLEEQSQPQGTHNTYLCSKLQY